MNYTIKDIRINELRKFIDSTVFKKLKNIPISYHRAISYINNPHAKSEDIAITMLFINDEIVAYRCLYSDIFYHKEEKVSFSWISGSWVHPDYRRQGYSMILLKHCLEKKNEHLMFSNFAPESKALYDKSGVFTKVNSLEGRRFFIRFSSSELLPHKYNFFKSFKHFLILIDFLLNLFFDIRFLIYRSKIENCHFTETDGIDTETQNFININNSSNPFKRNASEINHSLRFPWVIEKEKPDEEDNKYYFSSSSKCFKIKNIKVFNSEGNIAAFFIFKIRNNSMSIPYFYFQQEEEKKLIDFIYSYIKKYKINDLSIYNDLLINEFRKRKLLILFSKKRERTFYASKKIAGMFEVAAKFFDGDGDSLYT